MPVHTWYKILGFVVFSLDLFQLKIECNDCLPITQRLMLGIRFSAVGFRILDKGVFPSPIMSR